MNNEETFTKLSDQIATLKLSRKVAATSQIQNPNPEKPNNLVIGVH